MFLTLGMIFLLDRARGRRLAEEFLDGEVPLFFSGLMTLLAGLAIVNTHAVWTGWPLAITLFGWLMVIAGLVRLLVPGPAKRLGRAMLARGIGLRLPAGLLALVGAWFVWCGYGG